MAAVIVAYIEYILHYSIVGMKLLESSAPGRGHSYLPMGMADKMIINSVCIRTNYLRPNSVDY
jgi:hypothetical protein